MEVLKLLFTSWIGLLSLFTVAFAIGMVIYLFVFFSRESKKGPE
ncbi:MAG: DUF3149 domain-containing protein [Chromatiales bacterium]|jgi:hypothetical protein|nr:DUF3149 domain-containing protein [Chromatiales bacterium]MDX9766843.1 DUF3149 domain-containing protein [Ectothiorhodospiraceae bacterium]